jgi:hypothetical protein
LYRAYNSEGSLLYVGISYSALIRITAHRRDKPWFGDVARIEVEKVPGDRYAAEERERQAIWAERPLHNVVHNHGNTPITRTPPSPTPRPAGPNPLLEQRRALGLPDTIIDPAVLANVAAVLTRHHARMAQVAHLAQ